jgi:antirestriction protein ArdC
MSTIDNNATNPRDVYQKVTDAIINSIEQGAGSYRMPWVVRQDKGFSPISVSTAKPYHGINTLVLWAQAQTKGYSSSLWGSYRQWQSLGAQVRKGEHGSPVVYWGTYENESKESQDNETDSTRTRLFCKGYTVFNLEQVDGAKLPKRFDVQLSAFLFATAETVRSIVRIPTRCTCRISVSFPKHRITIPCSRMKPLIGLRTRHDAIAS